MLVSVLDTPCQESSRMRGSVGSFPRHGSWPVVLPCHQLVSSDGDRQRAGAFYQMDQRGHTHPNS